VPVNRCHELPLKSEFEQEETEAGQTKPLKHRRESLAARMRKTRKTRVGPLNTGIPGRDDSPHRTQRPQTPDANAANFREFSTPCRVEAKRRRNRLTNSDFFDFGLTTDCTDLHGFGMGTFHREIAKYAKCGSGLPLQMRGNPKLPWNPDCERLLLIYEQ
jgi:hypothetical protein